MAKKKGGGETASKKSLQKKKAASIEDKTFGLKNKNKSKKVQQFVNQVERSVLNGGDPKERAKELQRAKLKADNKLRRKALKQEQDALFGEALMAVQSKASLKKGKVEAKGRDADEENTKKSTSRAMKMMYQMDAKEMDEKLREDPNYVPTLEDEIELQRSTLMDKLQKEGKKGTPVTPTTFAAWQDRKRKARAEAAKKIVEAEFKKKKGGKGLSILSGRDLYEYKKELFNKDDEEDEGALGVNNVVEHVAATIQSDLFLQGDDDDLDDLEDD